MNYGIDRAPQLGVGEPGHPHEPSTVLGRLDELHALLNVLEEKAAHLGVVADSVDGPTMTAENKASPLLPASAGIVGQLQSANSRFRDLLMILDDTTGRIARAVG